MPDDLDIVTFAEDPQLLNLKLWPGQRIILKCAYGLALTAAESDMVQKMSLDPIEYERREYSDALLVLGSRSGKSLLAAIIAAYESVKGDYRKYLRRGEYGYVVIVSTRLEQSRDLIGSTTARLFRDSPLLRTLVVEDRSAGLGGQSSTSQRLVLSNHTVILGMPCTSRAGRGYPIPVLICDEIAHFSREGERADSRILNSLIPRQAQFGNAAKLVLISTPADRSGELYRRWKERERFSAFQFCLRAPTWKVNPNIDKAFLDRQRAVDPISFNVEFGAHWADAISGLLNAEKVEQCFGGYDQLERQQGRIYFAAIDPAFRSDSFGFAIGHREGDKVKVDFLRAYDPPFDIDGVLHDIAAQCKRYRVSQVQTDQYSGDMIVNALAKFGLRCKVQPWTGSFKRKIFSRVKALVEAGMISLPENARARRELCSLEVRYRSTGDFSIGHPAGSGYSDDLADVIGVVADLAMQGRELRLPSEWFETGAKRKAEAPQKEYGLGPGKGRIETGRRVFGGVGVRVCQPGGALSRLFDPNR